jgi:hypothetical protein
MIEEIPTFVYRCPTVSCGYVSDPFEWRSEAVAAETAHLDEHHTPILDDELVVS